MIKNLKKAFTIIELVIVIAVIAILAAVMIPTYSSLVDKANQSADIQAVKQMNTILATYVDGSVTNIDEAISALDKDNIDLEDYKPLQKDHYFYFYMDGKTPKVVYTDANDKAVYPENANISGVQLMSLSGDVPTDGSYKIENGSVSINSGAQLVHLIDSKKGASAEQPLNEDLTITLSGNVDLRGAAVDFGVVNANIIIKGDESSKTTLSGLRADNNSVSPTTGEFAKHTYGFGIFGKIDSGTVKLENITISGISAGNTKKTHSAGANTVGLLAGYIGKDAKVELTNVTFENCSVNGYQKVGGLVGQLYGTLDMKNVKFENCSVNGVLEVAKIAGITTKTANLKFDNNCDFTGITTKALTDDVTGYFDMSDINYDLNGDSANRFGYWATVKVSQCDINKKDEQGFAPISYKKDGNGKYVLNDKGQVIAEQSENIILFGIVTNDLAWYIAFPSKDSTKEEGITQEYMYCPRIVNVKGDSNSYYLNNWVNSTSNQIVNGQPTNK